MAFKLPRLPRNYRDVVDELGAVQAELSDIDRVADPLRDREKELRDQVLTWCKTLPPEADFSMQGECYSLGVSPQRIERTITSMAKLYKRLGAKWFFSVCAVALKHVDECLSPVQQKGLVAKARTGPRTITTSPIMAAVKRKAA